MKVKLDQSKHACMDKDATLHRSNKTSKIHDFKNFDKVTISYSYREP